MAKSLDPLRKVLTVDLASRFSAVCVMDELGIVREQFDSWGKTSFAFLSEIVNCALLHNVDSVIIEDVPYGLSKQFMIKPVLRLQGAVMLALDLAGLLEQTVFLNPSTWQRTFEGVYKGKEAGALAAASLFGYSPPDMLLIHDSEIPAHGKDRARVRAQLKKASTDYVDAFLIAKFTLTFSGVPEMLGKPGMQAPSI